MLYESEVGRLDRKTAGVGALYVTPKQLILCITELTSSERTVKEAGMQSIPMESTNGDEIPEETLSRLNIEEVNFPPDAEIILIGRLCTVQINTAVWVPMYCFKVKRPYDVVIGTAKNEVASPTWLPLREVMGIPIGSNRLRPGVREAGVSYRFYEANPGTFEPLVFRRAVDTPLVLARLNSRVIQNGSLSHTGSVLQQV